MRAKRSIQADSNFCFVLFFHFICNVFLFLICLERFWRIFQILFYDIRCGWKFHPGFDAYVRYMYEGVLQSFTCIARKWCFPRWWRLPNRRQTCSRFFTELLFLLSSSKPLEERHKKSPFWFIGVYTEMTSGLEKLIVCF